MKFSGVALLAALTLLRCSGATSASAGGSGGGAAQSVAGSGTFKGSAAGKSVEKVAAAYLIGRSDDPRHTTVVYVFDEAVGCADIGAPGWDKRVTSATAALELKLIGVAPGKYAVATGATAAQGEASVNFTVTSKATTPAENGSKGGFVQLDTLDAGKHAAGSFNLQFSDGMLVGTFSAAWCEDGVER